MRVLTTMLLAALWCALPLRSTAQLSSPVSLEQLQTLASQHALDVLIAQRDNSISQLEVARLQAELKPQIGLNATIPSYFSSVRETVQPDGTLLFQPVNVNNSSFRCCCYSGFRQNRRFAAIIKWSTTLR